MKKVLILSLVFVFVCMIAAWMSVETDAVLLTIGDEDFDGPLGALLGTVLAGGVFAIVAVVLTFVAALVGFLMAGVGVLVILALALAALVTMAAVSPLLLPLLIPFAIYWLVKRRHRKPAEPAAPALEHTPA